MARPRRRSHSSLIEDLHEDPRAYAFFQAVRLIERAGVLAARKAGRELPEPVGRAGDPKKAAMRFRAAVSLGYVASEVTSIRHDAGALPEVNQSVFGLTGPAGALPHAFSELVQASVRDRNTGLREFLDLFNDRLTGLFYEAWAKYRLTIETERGELLGEQHGIDHVLRSLIGLGQPSLANRMQVPDHMLVHYGGLLSRQGRSQRAVMEALSGALGHRVAVKQFHGAWLPIAPADRTRLAPGGSAGGQFNRLGEDTVIGQAAWDVQGSVCLMIDELKYPVFRSLLPDGDLARGFADLAGFALGADMAFQIALTLRPEEVPVLVVGGKAKAPTASRLGWNTWLNCPPARRRPGEVCFSPPAHLR
jgi:type VI secretion system protein ImpH